MTIKQIRRGYSRVFKLMRLADRNSNMGEATAALHQAEQLMGRLASALERRARIYRRAK